MVNLENKRRKGPPTKLELMLAAKDMTLEQFAVQLGAAYSTVYRIVRGKKSTSVSMIMKMAEILTCPMEEIVNVLDIKDRIKK